jgi:modulator of FtsH protease HflK
MSESHDHPHPHPGQQREPLPPARPLPPAPPPSREGEDTGTQALSEALRSSFVIVKVIMVILVIVFFASGVFTVPSQEKAIILRFGKPVGVGEQQLLEPGLHWSFPYPIDEVVPIRVGQIHNVTSTVGWYASDDAWVGDRLNPAVEGYTLTGDGNIVHVRARLSYRISDPLAYALNFSNSSEMVQNVADNAILYASARTPVDEALLNVTAFQETVLARVRRLVDEKQLGISLEPSEVRVIAPRYLRPFFEDVQTAEESRRKTISDAQAQSNRSLNMAQAEADAIRNAGQTERTRFLQSVESEAAYFKDQLPYYLKDPRLFMARVQAETMHQILTNQNLEARWVIPSQSEGRSRDMWIHLNREMEAPRREEPQAGNRR